MSCRRSIGGLQTHGCAFGAFACILLLALVGRAYGFIQRLYSLREVLGESDHVLVGRLAKVDAGARTAVAAMDRALKGKLEFKKVLMNIAIGPAHHAEYVMKRLRPDAPVILFYKHTEENIASLVHAGGIWFQLFAKDRPGQRQKVWWRMSHVEIYMNRTYNGHTPDLIRLTQDVLAKRVKDPKPDPTVPTLELKKRPKPVKAAIGKGSKGGFHRRLRFAHDGGAEIRGICWADVDGDELPDVLLCRQRADVLLTGKPGGLVDSTSRLGLSGGSRSAGWADYDGDDHPDLLTSNFRVFANVGGALREKPKLLPAPGRRNPEGAGWIDYNADGRPDVLITNGQYGIRLYENTGTKPGWFRDVSDKAGLGAKGLGVGNGDFIACFDADNDGYTDFFYNLGGGVLARNAGDGTFKPEPRCGIKLTQPGYKRGLAVGDFNNDGRLDLFVPGPGRAQLYRNNAGGTFTDVIGRAGDLAKAASASFGAAFGDVNCDGCLDLLVCHPKRAARLYLGDGKGRFTDVSKRLGADALKGAMAASFADVDADGDPDLVANLPGQIVLAFNDVPRPAGFAPVTVGVHVRRGLVGSVVRALDRKGRPVGLRQLALPEGCGCQGPPTAHFALPAGKHLLTVCLSDGRAARQTVNVQDKPIRLTFRESQFK